MFIEIEDEIINLNFLVSLSKEKKYSILDDCEEYFVAIKMNDGTRYGYDFKYFFEDEFEQENFYRGIRSKILSYNSK